MEHRLVFPDKATNEERQVRWQKIAEITDGDFGFNTPKAKSNKFRFNVRLLMQGKNNLICAVKSEKYGYMQLPGGGIENNESIIDALRRETREEAGFLINCTANKVLRFVPPLTITKAEIDQFVKALDEIL